MVAVRWYLRYGLAYRDIEELLLERGVEVDHVTVFRWVQRFTPLLADAARFCRHAPGDRWFVDETYVKVGGVWRYVYRAVDQYGQVIDVLVSVRRDAPAARRFFRRALKMLRVTPSEVVTDAAAVYPAVLDELVPSAWHHVERYSNNPIEADHSQLKQRPKRLRLAEPTTTRRSFLSWLSAVVSDLSVSRQTAPYLPTQPPAGQDRTMKRMRSLNLFPTMLCAAALSLATSSLTACSDSGSPSNTGTAGVSSPAADATGTAPAGGPKTVSAKALCDYLSGQLPKLKAMGSEVGAMANLTGNLYSWYNGQGIVPDGNQMDEQTLKECPNVRTEVLKAAGVKTFMEL